MALIVIFDEVATPQNVTDVIPSADTGQYIGRTDYLANPDLTAVQGVEQKYWKHVGGAIVEYTQAEKNAQDAAEAAALDLQTREGAKSRYDGTVGLHLRAFADIMKDEINILRSQHSLSDRTLAQLKSAIQSRIDSGGVDE